MTTSRPPARARSGAAPKARGGAKGQRLDARGVAELLDAAAGCGDPVCVVIGPEDALRRLLMDRLTAQVAGRDITVVRLSGSDGRAAEAIGHACEPTLFGGATWLAVTELDQAGEDVVEAAKRAVGEASPDLRILISHGGGARGRGVINAAEKAGARVFEARAVAASALPAVLTGHARKAGKALTADAAAALIAAIGHDLSALLAVTDQLASDAAGETIDIDLVRQTLASAGSENQFEIADLVWGRRTGEALEAFRMLAERNGAASACVTLVAALSYSLRGLVRFVAERPTGSAWQIAAALGVPAWKVDGIAAQARLWQPAQLAAAALMLAGADADAKGGLGDAGALDEEQKLYAVESLIVRLAAAPA